MEGGVEKGWDEGGGGEPEVKDKFEVERGHG